MFRYLSLGKICSLKLPVFLEPFSQQTFCFSEQIISANKYSGIFLCQMEAVVCVSWDIAVRTYTMYYPASPQKMSHNMLNLERLTVQLGLIIYFHYYSFKIFIRFWLVKTIHIIHHNQLLWTKHWTNDLKSAARYKINYWTDDIKMTSKVQPTADYWTVDRENLGTRLCYFRWVEKQRLKWRNFFKNV